MSPMLKVASLSVSYKTTPLVRAVSDVDLEVNPNTCLCIVGESGCGKSTLSSAIGRILPENGHIDAGEVFLDGQEISKMDENRLNREVRWKKCAIIFQNAATSLNPFLRIRDQIIEVLTRHLGMSKRDALGRSEELLLGVKFPVSRIGAYPHQLSGGMKQRVAIAIALACGSKLVLGDEIATGLDVTTSAQIAALLSELVSKGLTLVLNTHDIGFAVNIADNVAVMYAGRIVEFSPMKRFIKNPIHPYSMALLRSIPRSRDPGFKPRSIPGEPPRLWQRINGCPFAPRCNHAQEICFQELPLMTAVGDGSAACHFAGRLEQPQ